MSGERQLGSLSQRASASRWIEEAVGGHSSCQFGGNLENRKKGGEFIEICSEEGRGTAFKVYLLRVEEPLTTHAAQERHLMISEGTETILLVEDDEALRVLTTKFLMDSGYRVLKAANGEDAIRLARDFDGVIDLLLTDVVMPKMGGKQLAEQLRLVRPHTKVLYMSGYPNEGPSHAGLTAHGFAILGKPFNRDTLLKRVRQLLNTPPEAK